MDRLEAHRAFYAKLVTANAGVQQTDRLVAAFASVPRERFVGPGPWRVFTRGGYVSTPDDPAFLYQDVVVALKSEAKINNGQPTLHAACLAALRIVPGEAVVHVGAGTGYYTAILAELTGPTGSVVAYEVDDELVRKATANLAEYCHVTVKHRSGSEAPLPACDVIYVSAGATDPMDVWLDALRPGGRLLFPLTAAEGAGGMLLLTRTAADRIAARFVCQAVFIPCLGARDDEVAKTLTDAFKRGGLRDVQSLRRHSSPDATSWCAGRGWWLSTALN